MTAHRTLVLGGVRSGKTAWAEATALATGLTPVYLATAQAFDDGMRARIEAHRAGRDARWTLLEESLELPAALAVETAQDRIVLVDCLTLWLTNLMLAERTVEHEAALLVNAVQGVAGPLILVSNEVGLGGIAADPMARVFADHAGRLHQALAAVCEEVVLVAAGLPMRLKPCI